MKVDVGIGSAETPYWMDDFDSFLEAADAQRRWLRIALEEGYAIRAASIECEKDFETRQLRWRAFVRAWKVIAEAA